MRSSISRNPAQRLLDVNEQPLALALSPDERERVKRGLGREPSTVEWFAFDAQWSEHCSYKSSRPFLRRLPTTSDAVIIGPGEDAGVVRLGEHDGKTYAIVVAHESHNHPSQVVPFEGAATGIGGIVRDVLCMGAQLIGVADPLRFGTSKESRYIAQGVVDGVASYGNAIGIPNIGGDVYFDSRFDDNVLVNVVALGIVEENAIIHSRAPQHSVGWDIILVGKATDRSGFGGASFSSLQLDAADAETNKGAVQVPDAFLKSVLMRASYRVFEVLREEGLEVAFKDLGAGGVMGCSAEIVSSGGLGARIELDKVPLAEPNLPPAVITVGETQERMCWVVPPSFTPRLLAIYNQEFDLPGVARGAQAARIGTVTQEKRYVATYGGQTVMDVDIDFLTGGILHERPFELPQPPKGKAVVRDVDLPSALPHILADRDVCSRAPIFERYDGVVRGTTAIPRGYADAGVIVPVPGAPLGVALGLGGNPRYGALDPRRAAEQAVVESARNVAAVGARPVALTDCLNFGDADDPRQFGEFVAAIDGLAEVARALDLPFISGNVSLYNTSASGKAVPASPIVACIGAIADISKIASPALKASGSSLYMLGARQDALGGSIVSRIVGGELEPMPEIDVDAVHREIALLLEGYAKHIVLGAHDISDGGLAVTVCEMTFEARRRGLGARIDSPSTWATDIGTAGAWFGETGGFVVEVGDVATWETLAREHDVTPIRIGEVTGDARVVFDDASWNATTLYEIWSAPLRGFYDASEEES
ncbi:MAG: phosphoribosylformylglycinamidine synthase subunit PurL [Vulcanimicrobiaceae bacterium]|jgi:phosphoribosylformylglycinamidine synthase